MTNPHTRQGGQFEVGRIYADGAVALFAAVRVVRNTAAAPTPVVIAHPLIPRIL